MLEIILFIGCVFAVITLVSYFKNLAPDLRKEQIKTITDSGLVVTGFGITTAKDWAKTAVTAGRVGAKSVEHNHKELSKSVAESVNTFVAEQGKGNALRAGAKTSKDLSKYTGMEDLNNSMKDYLDFMDKK